MNNYNTRHHSQYPLSLSKKQLLNALHSHSPKPFRLAALLLVIAMMGGNLLPSYATAADFFELGGKNVWGISGDGNVAVGNTSVGQAFIWNEVDGLVNLGFLPGYDSSSRAYAASTDGSVVTGYSQGSAGSKAFRWTSAGGMVDLGTLGGTYTRAYGVSADGNVVVGYGYNDTGNTVIEAFRWTPSGNIAGLGDLPGGDFYSIAHAVSGDGSVVVGGSKSGSQVEAFRWTETGGMVGLGMLPGASDSWARGVSADGSVIVGYSGVKAFLWTEAGGMVALDFDAASDVSSDGSVIVGRVRGVSPSGSVSDLAVRWTAAGGTQTVREWLGAAGITTNWRALTYGAGVSDDGCSVAGYGANANLNYVQLEGFLARVATAGGCNTGVAVPDITVTDSTAPVDDLGLAFGNVTEQTSSGQLVTVTNNGKADLVIGTLAVADALAVPFALGTDNCSGKTLTPATSCTVAVRFTPPSTGSFNDSFDIPSDDPDENPVTVSVNGTGIGLPVPDITITDSVSPVDDLAIGFGFVTQATSLVATVNIANDGNADLSVGNIAALDVVAAPFSIQNDACSGTTVIAGGSCSLDVIFEPTAAGSFTDSFDIPSDDADEASVTVIMKGTGVAVPVPDITVTDTVAPTGDLQVAFGNIIEGDTSEQTVTLRNDGTADLVIGQIARANVLAAPFTVLNDTCSVQTLPPTANCTFTVRFSPTSVIASSDSLDIPCNDVDENPVTVNVSGAGVAASGSATGTTSTSSNNSSDGIFGIGAFNPLTLLAMFMLSTINLAHRRRGS